MSRVRHQISQRLNPFVRDMIIHCLDRRIEANWCLTTSNNVMNVGFASERINPGTGVFGVGEDLSAAKDGKEKIGAFAWNHVDNLA